MHAKPTVTFGTTMSERASVIGRDGDGIVECVVPPIDMGNAGEECPVTVCVRFGESDPVARLVFTYYKHAVPGSKRGEGDEDGQQTSSGDCEEEDGCEEEEGCEEGEERRMPVLRREIGAMKLPAPPPRAEE